MPHHFFDIGAIILLASAAAVLLAKLKQQPIIGYVVAGIIVGPAGFGLIASEKDIALFAELGVILLLFILGMELPLDSFKKSYKIAVPATLILVGLSLGLVFLIGLAVEVTIEQKIVYGFIISLSSTAVAVKLLEDVDLMSTNTGQIAISVLIAQDLLFVPMIMIINGMGGADGIDLVVIPKMIAAVALLIALIWYLSRRDKVNLLFYKTVEKYQDLIPVAALTWCLVGAGASEYFGFSPAFGAFVAGLIIGSSNSKHIVLPKIMPMQSVMLMIFFLSIGMLINFDVIMNNWRFILGLLLSAMLFKTIVCIGLLRAFLPNERWRCSFVTGLTISQIGEFSFVLAGAALAVGVFDQEKFKILISVIALSLVFSPIWMILLRKFVDVAYGEQAAVNLRQAIIRCLKPAGKNAA